MARRCDFSLNHYAETLISYREVGFQVGNTPLKDSPILALVHDIDFDVDAAIDLARLEFELSVHSTYFVRLAAKHYNPISRAVRARLEELVDLGHALGLHFERYDGQESIDNRLLAENVAEALSFAQKYVHPSIDVFNFHEPSRTGLDLTVGLQGDRRYNSEYYSGYKYLSDSGGRWREGCFCKWTATSEKMLVLTHPVWWFKDTPTEKY